MTLCEETETSRLGSFSLRRRIQAVDALVDDAPSNCRVWRDLLEGSCKAIETFLDAERCYLVVTRSELAQARCLKVTEQAIVERAVLGEAQKSVAFDMGVGISTIACITKHCLAFMGLPGLPSRVPVSLVMMAVASLKGNCLPRSRVSELQYCGVRLQLWSAPRPDRGLAGILSPSERAVVGMLVEGRSHCEIARLRMTSVRTVANQLASAFRRLGVSGRGQLLSALVHEQFSVRPMNLTSPAHYSPETVRRGAELHAAF